MNGFVMRCGAILFLVMLQVYAVDEAIFNLWIGDRIPKNSLHVVGPHAGWGDISDDVKDILLGDYWRDCTHPIGSEEGLDFLLEKAAERLKKVGKKAPEMVKDVTPTFNAYIKKNVLYAESWLKDAGSLKEVASNFLPGDEMAQATAVLNMMTYYVHCYDHKSEGQDNMFMYKEMPIPDNRYGVDFLLEDYSEIINYQGLLSGWNFLYLFQEKYEFSFIDFVVALRGLGGLAVLPKNWNKKYSAHGSFFTGLYTLLTMHDFTHANNLEKLLIFMENLDVNFVERMNKTIYEVLKKFWVKQGPRMLAGCFYTLHETGEDDEDTRDHIIFEEDVSPLTKMQVILMAGAQRKVTDAGMSDVIRKIERKRYCRFFNDAEAIQEAAKDFVLEFMHYYSRFPVSPSNDLAEIVMRSWFGEKYKQYEYKDVLPVIFEHINQKDSREESVHLLPITAATEYLFFRRNSLYHGHPVGPCVATFLPTKEVVDGYSFLQRQQFVRVHRIANRLYAHICVQLVCRDKSLTTQWMLCNIEKRVYDAIFGQGLCSRKLWLQKEAESLWDEIADKKRQGGMREALVELMCEAWSLGAQKTRDEIVSLTESLRKIYGMRKSRALMMILFQEYIQAKHRKDTSHKAIAWFEQEGWPKLEEIAKYEVKPGACLCEQLKKWQCLPKCVWSMHKMPLFERVVVISKDQYPVDVLSYGKEGFESVYDQCQRIEQRIRNEASWVIDGKSAIADLKRIAKESVLMRWEQEGVFVLPGFDLLMHNISLKRMRRALCGEKIEIDFHLCRLTEDIEKAPDTHSWIVEALARYIQKSFFMQVCSVEKQMMYLFVTAHRKHLLSSDNQ